MNPEPCGYWAIARDFAALALDALDGPETPEALGEAIDCVDLALLTLTDSLAGPPLANDGACE